MIAAGEAVWCGLRKGRDIGMSAIEAYKRELIFATSMNSLGVSGGSRLAAVWARRVLPEPGGPQRRMLC